MEIFSGESLTNLIKLTGYLGLFSIVFAESGLLIGFFLPGDSLLFTAGFLASQGHLNIILLNTIVFVAAVLGDNVGYAFGNKVGPKLFKRDDSIFFHKDNLTKASLFFEKHGPKSLVLARFVPVVRTFVPILAGVGKMDYKVFVTYNIAGGLFWTVLLTVSGYFLGKIVPDIDKYLLPIVLVIIIVSVAPPLYHLLKDRLKNK